MVAARSGHVDTIVCFLQHGALITVREPDLPPLKGQPRVGASALDISLKCLTPNHPAVLLLASHVRVFQQLIAVLALNALNLGQDENLETTMIEPLVITLLQCTVGQDLVMSPVSVPTRNGTLGQSLGSSRSPLPWADVFHSDLNVVLRRGKK
jgi:hypothetical protein